MIEVVVARLGMDSSNQSYVLVLQEKGGPRLLPIWIGQPEAESIVMQIHNIKRVRPLTHDLCKSLKPYMKRHHMQAGVGHYGVFSGRRWETQVYPLVRNMILANE